MEKKPIFNADNAEEYFSMQLGYYRACQKDMFNRDNQGRDSNNFVYSAEYQKYLGMEMAMCEVLEYFGKYELQPTANAKDAEPVVRGEWERMTNPYGDLEGFMCACGRTSQSADNYCPNCGADMRGEP